MVVAVAVVVVEIAHLSLVEKVSVATTATGNPDDNLLIV